MKKKEKTNTDVLGMTLLQWAWDRRDTALKGYVSIYSTKDDQYRVTTKAAQLKRRRKEEGCIVEQLGTQRGKFEANSISKSFNSSKTWFLKRSYHHQKQIVHAASNFPHWKDV